MDHDRPLRLHWARISLGLLLLLTLTNLPNGSFAQDVPTITPPTSHDLPPLPGLTLQQQKTNPKLDTALRVGNASGGTSLQADAMVQVEISLAPEQLDAARAAVLDGGGRVQIVSTDGLLMQVWLPGDQLEAVAENPAIQYIREPMRPESQPPVLSAGDAETEGLYLMGAEAWHAANYKGAGQKVAIIDLGFEGHEQLLGSDLPDEVVYADFVDPQTNLRPTPHGTACAEIIHDLAPEAELYLVRISSRLELAQAVIWLAEQEVTIISTSLSFFNDDAGDGTGFLASLVAAAREAGILWVTSAGNQRRNHWGGDALDRDGDKWMAVGGTNELNWISDPLPAGRRITYHLRWSDWENVDQDIELVVVRWNGATWDVYAVSENYQSGLPGQRPTEDLTIVTSGPTTYYGVALYRYNVNRVVNVDLIVRDAPPLEVFDAPRSLPSLADAPAALTVSAINSSNPYAQEPYSSEGPTNGIGGTRGSGLLKPDISAFANVSTVTYGFRVFGGTSAATVHVTGAAAILASAYPDASPTQLQNRLENTAIDRGRAGKDTIFGAGQLFLGSLPTSNVPFDFDLNEKSDVPWWNSASGRSIVTLMDGVVELATVEQPLLGNPAKLPIGIGDADGDGRADRFWFDRESRRVSVQITGSRELISVARLANGHQAAAVADFNGDGVADLLIRNGECGCSYIWLLYNGEVLQAAGIDRRTNDWFISAVGDFNGDDQADILWKDRNSGRYDVWLIDGLRVISREILIDRPAGVGWRVLGTADFNGDGTDDLLWRNIEGPQEGWVRMVYLRDGQVDSWTNVYRVQNPDLRVVGMGDYQGDGKADLLWRNVANGGLYLNLHNGRNILAGAALGSAGSNWKVIGVGTADGEYVQPRAVVNSSELQQEDIDPGQGGVIIDPPAEANPGPEPTEPDVPDTDPPSVEVFTPIDDLLLTDGADIDELTRVVLARTTTAETTIHLPMMFR